jgi:hypothetical protein
MSAEAIVLSPRSALTMVPSAISAETIVPSTMSALETVFVLGDLRPGRAVGAVEGAALVVGREVEETGIAGAGGAGSEGARLVGGTGPHRLRDIGSGDRRVSRCA